MAKTTRLLFSLSFLLVVLAGAGATLARQEAPDVIDQALADLSQRKGETLTLDDFASWTWEQRIFPDASLGCPAPDKVYAQARTNGYVFSFTDYDNVTYDYRVSADGQAVILCVDGQPAESSQLPAAPTEAPTSTPSPPVACDFDGAHASYMPPQVSSGIEARVSSDGVPNNVRSNPTTRAEVVIQIPAGEEFDILADEPKCAGGLVWWHVEYKGYTGWTAEGKDGEYWIEPVEQPAVEATTAPPPAVEPDEPETAIISASNIDQLSETMAYQYDYPVTSPVLLDMGMVIFGTEDGAIHLVDPATGQPGLKFPAEEGHTAAVTALAYVQPDAGALDQIEAYPVLASGDVSGKILLWDMLSNAQTGQLEGHTGAVTALVFSADGTMLASGSMDGTVRLWETMTGKGLAVITAHTDAIVSLTLSEDGSQLVSSSTDGTVRLWELPR